MTIAPAAFFAHGSPMTALAHDDHTEALRAFGDAHSGPRAILAISAHWQKPLPLALTSWERAPLVYDFGGFPPELYRIEYPAPGDPGLAVRIQALLRGAGRDCALEPSRGLDHGAWVPLRIAWPDAKTPVLQLSLPEVPPADLFALGEALRPLRNDGVLIAASGGIVHNLRRFNPRDRNAPVETWSAEFDGWVARRIEEHAWGDLFEYRARAPHAALAVPTSEHFDPLFVALGAAFPGEEARPVYTGFQNGTFSMRSFAFGG